MFLSQSVVIGLAAAFIVVFLRPDLLMQGRGAPAPVAPPATALAGGTTSYASAVQRTAPAVVNIHTAKRVRPRPNPLLDDPALSRYFGEEAQGAARERIQETLGSGVIVRTDGYILTNNHVIEGAQAIQVALADGRVADAVVVGTDPDTDLALLRVDLVDLPVVELDPAEQVQVGDVVLAIGNPFGLGQTVTQGIISATGRSDLGLSTFENFLQTDAAINKGNSGGALINAEGDVVGINTAIFQLNGEGSGIGFAVPVSLARGVTDQLIRHGRVIRGWLGIETQEVTPELAEAFALKDVNAIAVRRVRANSPAEQGGIRRGDIITHIDGRPILSERDALNRIASTRPGTQVDLSIVRDGQTVSVKAKVGERPVQNVG
jgi:Do/DeqQ family serine protease